MKSKLRKKVIDEEFFLPDPSTYLACMARNFTFIDNLFLKFFVVLTNRDPLSPPGGCPGEQGVYVDIG